MSSINRAIRLVRTSLAINAALAPGSTMKIIDAAALFDRRGMSPGDPAPCRAEQVAAGQVFHNDAGVTADPHATIEDAFAESCNTAFVYDGFHYLVHGDQASVLHDEARDLFGLGSWSIGGGVQSADPSIPATPQGSDAAEPFTVLGPGLPAPPVTVLPDPSKPRPIEIGGQNGGRVRHVSPVPS